MRTKPGYHIRRAKPGNWFYIWRVLDSGKRYPIGPGLSTINEAMNYLAILHSIAPAAPCGLGSTPLGSH